MDISIGTFLQITQPVTKVFVWGMMGVGKSTFAKQLARSLAWEWVDLDQLIEATEGRSIPAIFELEGEDAFRSIEASVLKSTADKKHIVISVGGGTPCFGDHAAWMKAQGLTIWLDAPTGMLVQRLLHAKQKRPLLEGLDEEALRKKLEFLLEQRASFYREAHMIVNVLKSDAKTIAAQLQPIIQDKV